jgi:hypothetical protein
LDKRAEELIPPNPGEIAARIDEMASQLKKLSARLRQLAVQQGADDDLLDTREVADWLGVSITWLEKGRSARRPYGPPFLRLSPSKVRYERKAVKGWLQARQGTRTSVLQKRLGNPALREALPSRD